jgi:cadmium resistance protein CadD (predicted permease)
MLAAYLTALPIALGTILATAPVLAVPLLLVTRADRAPLHGFLAGWLAGFLVLGGLVMVFADIVLLAGQTTDLGLEGLRLALGLLLLYFAWRKWQKRPLPGQDPETPGWMTRFDTITPRGAALIGAGLAILNPKNTLLVISGALTIAAATHRPTAQAGALLLHSLTASAGLLAPLAAVLIGGDRASAPLERLRAAIARHNATVMAVVLGALGLYVILDAVLKS